MSWTPRTMRRPRIDLEWILDSRCRPQPALHDGRCAGGCLDGETLTSYEDCLETLGARIDSFER